MAAFFRALGLIAMSFARDPLSAILASSLMIMGSAGLLGVAVWQLCRLAVASWFQSEILFASRVVRVALRSRLDHGCLWA
jgi:hypothetical protein